MDRFDIHISVPSIQNYGAPEASSSQTSKEIAKRIKAVRQLQQERHAKYDIKLNNQLTGQAFLDHATPTTDAKGMLDAAANKFKLSMRAYNRILRVARTIADMIDDKVIDKIHLAEALNYRQMDYRLMKS